MVSGTSASLSIPGGANGSQPTTPSPERSAIHPPLLMVDLSAPNRSAWGCSTRRFSAGKKKPWLGMMPARNTALKQSEYAPSCEGQNPRAAYRPTKNVAKELRPASVTPNNSARFNNQAVNNRRFNNP